MKRIFILMLIVAFAGKLYANLGDTITLDLSKSLYPESFIYMPDGYWEETYNETDYTFIDFEHFSFSHLIEGNSWGGSSWDGFTVSISGDNTNYNENFSWDLLKQWGNMAGGGIKTDENGRIMKDENGKVLVEQGIPYLVAYWGFGSVTEEFADLYYLQTIITNENVPQKAVGVYVNMHPWVYYGNVEGSFPSRKFEEGDYFKLFIHALDENHKDNGKVVEYTLAEFTDGTLHQNSDWEWIDLSSLGEVYGFRYTLETTDIDPVWGPNTPMFFCLDKLQVLKKPDGIKNNEIKTNIAIYPNPFTDNIVINTTDNGTATIYNLSGSILQKITLKEGSNHINTSELPQGIYILRYNNNAVKIVKK